MSALDFMFICFGVSAIAVAIVSIFLLVLGFIEGMRR